MNMSRCLQIILNSLYFNNFYIFWPLLHIWTAYGICLPSTAPWKVSRYFLLCLGSDYLHDDFRFFLSSHFCLITYIKRLNEIFSHDISYRTSNHSSHKFYVFPMHRQSLIFCQNILETIKDIIHIIHSHNKMKYSTFCLIMQLLKGLLPMIASS